MRNASRTILRVCFPAALLLFVGFFFAGRLGWWSDDHWHCQRDVVTGAVRAWTMERGFFLRPLFYVVVPAVTTALWEHDWMAHAVQIAAHGCVTVMLWRLMLMLGVSRGAAGGAALLFMVYPAQFEALYWVSALPTVLSAGLMLGVIMLAVQFARARAWWSVGAMGVMTFAACCLNEQAASAAAVLPLVAWVERRRTQRTQRGEGEPQRKTEAWMGRALAPGVVCVVACALYIVILRMSLRGAPAGVRGGAGTLVTLDGLWDRVVYFGDVLWRRLVMKNFGAGALKEGWSQVAESGWLAWGALLGVVALGVLWALVRRDRSRAEVEGSAPDGGGWTVALLGIAVFAVGWLPILVMAVYEPDSRCRYWPDVGLAMVVGAAIQGCARKGTHPHGPAEEPLTRGTVAMRLVLVAVLVVWSVMLVGVQAGFANRWRWDREQGGELKRLVPDPGPYTMFVPLRVEQRALLTGSPVLDPHFRSVWEFPWSALPFAQRVYRREDVRCGYWRQWTTGIPVSGADEQGIHYDDKNMVAPRFPRLADGTNLIPWERCVPFVVEADGTLRVVTRVVLELEGEADVAVDVPQTKGLPRFEARLKRL